jgi:multiple sugar transport system substrate-binding protein
MATSPLRLRGITWDHTRGLLPLQAASQRWHELHPQVEIAWEKRSLKDFGDAPIAALVDSFDLLVIDHPFVGRAAHSNILLPLDGHLDAEFLADQEAHSVGRSHPSYSLGGRHWALAIDAATPVASWRPDLLERPPRTWDELLELADRGLVAIPAVPIDALMAFYGLCIAEGEEPFLRRDRVVGAQTGARALARLCDLTRRCDPACLGRNPIATYEAMTGGDAIAYCPFAYGYSNYARPGYARRTLAFGDPPVLGDGPVRTTLGGTGLAISARCPVIEAALDFARFVASPGCQSRLYVQAGGQPGHRSAWTDEEANRISGGYFRDTLGALDRAYLRPRYHGYMGFQDHGALVVHAALSGERAIPDAMAELDRLYRASLQQESRRATA